MRGDFILILERPSLFFYKQKQVFFWHFRCFVWAQDLVFGFQESSDFDNQGRSVTWWILGQEQLFSVQNFLLGCRGNFRPCRYSPGSHQYHLHGLQLTKKESKPFMFAQSFSVCDSASFNYAVHARGNTVFSFKRPLASILWDTHLKWFALSKPDYHKKTILFQNLWYLFYFNFLTNFLYNYYIVDFGNKWGNALRKTTVYSNNW